MKESDAPSWNDIESRVDELGREVPVKTTKEQVSWIEQLSAEISARMTRDLFAAPSFDRVLEWAARNGMVALWFDADTRGLHAVVGVKSPPLVSIGLGLVPD